MYHELYQPAVTIETFGQSLVFYEPPDNKFDYYILKMWRQYRFSNISLLSSPKMCLLCVFPCFENTSVPVSASLGSFRVTFNQRQAVPNYAHHINVSVCVGIILFIFY